MIGLKMVQKGFLITYKSNSLLHFASDFLHSAYDKVIILFQTTIYSDFILLSDVLSILLNAVAVTSPLTNYLKM